MSRNTKPDDNLKDRIKSLFGIKEKSAPVTFQRPSTKEFIFTPEVLKDIGPESPANNRLRTIRELCDVVQAKKLEENAIEALWGSVKDLVQSGVPRESREVALHFLHSLINGQMQYLGILRAHFFNVIQNLTVLEDLTKKLELFRLLSENGRNFQEFEETAGPFLQQLMTDMLASYSMSDFLALLVNSIKYNAAYLDEDVVSGLVQQTCMIPNRLRSEEDIKLCLDVLDAVICYSYLPTECLQHMIAALCRMVNMPKYCQSSWDLMRKLLGTHLGHSGIYTMCCMLQDRRTPTDHKLLRGAVFYVGMALWGSRKVPTLKHTYGCVLPSFLQVLSTNSHIVAYEVVLSIQRLVKKYGKDLQHVTWNIIMDILESVLKLLEIQVPNQPPPDPRMPADFHDILTAIEELHTHGQFSGCVTRFFKIIEMCASKRPESSVSLLISHHAQMIQPMKEHWITNLYQLLEKYFKQDPRTQIRTKSLAVLSFVLSVNKHLHEDELINNVVLPHLKHIDNDHDPEVRKVAAEMLLCLAQSCSHQCFLDILALLEKMISKPMVPKMISPFPALEGEAVLQQRDESHIVDITTTLIGLVDLMKQKLYMYPAVESLKIYEILINHMEAQYNTASLYTSHAAAKVRKLIMEMLLHMRSDSLHRLGFKNVQEETQLMKYSPYVVCKLSEESEVTVVTSPGAVEMSAFQWTNATLLDYTSALTLFVRSLQQDRDWQVIQCVLSQLQLLLQNKTLILSSKTDQVDTLCRIMCAMVNDRQLGFPEKLTSVPPSKFTRSDFHIFVFPVLASLVSYHNYLDRNRQKELIKCLEFGLVSKCAKMCTNALRLCTLEMQHVMMRQLPAVLLQLSKISATISMAIPVLAFLSSIVRLPNMYGNFVEDEYMSVFAIALPYTNPFKFSHYTVSLAHHVIAIWFIRCRLPFRKGFVKFIEKGLRANVLQLFEENSRLHFQNEDSSDRSRASTYSEAGLQRRRRILSGSTTRGIDYESPVNDKMSQFHKELTETCSDFLARYTFANYNAVPHRSPEAEFLLNGGQSQTWLLGNKIITITTSGSGGNKIGNTWLCDRCYAMYQSQEKKPTQVETPGRRRHKSAMLSRSTSTVQDSFNRSTLDDLGIQQRSSLDDMSLPQSSAHDMGVQTGTSLTEHGSASKGFATEAVESMLWGLTNQSSDGRIFSNNMCNCWCTGWAEILIRAASGNLSWMMRIENESNLTSLQETQMTDITMLFASMNKNKQSDIESLKSSSRIDSGSIGEDEYESLYDQHFPSDSGSNETVQIQVPVDSREDYESKHEHDITADTVSLDEGGLAIPRSSNNHDPASLTNLLKKSNSSPSLLSSSCETTDTRDSISDIGMDFLKSSESDKGTRTSKKHRPGESEFFTSEESDSMPQSSTSSHQALRPDDLKLSNQLKENLLSPSHLSFGNRRNNLSPPHNHSPSPPSSESSSVHDEVSELPAFRKPRGHTISTVTSDSKHDDIFSRTKMGGMKESGRGGINPSFVFLQLYHGGLLHHSNEKPVLLPQSEAIKRSLKMLDRIHPYETHKVGVIYVGPGQTKDEKAILQNCYGSERYAKFVQKLGQLLRLEDCDPDRLYIGGLDIHGSDGKYAFGWHDETMHVIFHIATLMPNKESDPNCNAKKLHIGNDYVTVVYNDSGEEYKIGTIKGQFNYVNIVIKPLDYESNAVTLQAKEVPFKDSITTDIAEILGHKDTKIISDNNLHDLVRQIAVNCDLASMVLQRQQTQPQDPFASNWLERMRHIRRIREKAETENQQQNMSPQHSHKTFLDNFTEYV